MPLDGVPNCSDTSTKPKFQMFFLCSTFHDDMALGGASQLQTE